jgi:predicted permease
MSFFNIFTTTFPLFVSMLVGIVASKMGFFTRATVKDLSGFVTKVLFPLFLFKAAITNVTDEYLFSAPIYALLHIVVILTALVISKWVVNAANISPERTPIMRFCSVVGNTGFFGVIFAETFFGKDGIAGAILYDFGGSLVLFFVLIPFLLNRQNIRSPKSMLKQPTIIAVLLGAILGMLGFSIPKVILPAYETITGVTLPLALIVCGAQLGRIQFRREKKFWQVIYVFLMKMIMMPILLYGLIFFIPMTLEMKRFFMLEATMPCGISMVNFAEAYNQDSDFAAFSTFVTTTIAIVWIPLVLTLTTILPMGTLI